MSKNKHDPVRYDDAKHNEDVCDHLNTNTKFSDWVITTAFYSALHFVSYKLFPIEIKHANQQKYLINDINDYKRRKQSSESKHTLLAQLVSEKLPDISADYDWLKDMAHTARYSNYIHAPEIAAKARGWLKKIKGACPK